MYEIKVDKRQDLHLAAFMKSHGAELIATRGKEFIFKSDKDADQWRIDHVNSSDLRTDQELLKLKRLL